MFLVYSSISAKIWKPCTYTVRILYGREVNALDELVKLVSDKVGISEDMAKQAVDSVLDYLKDRLPAPVAGQIDGLLGGTGEARDPGSMVKGLGDLLGK
jgi:hypothetical protein